jgi:hypothetical protein
MNRSAGPFLGLNATNRGRRPVKLASYGLEFSDGMRSAYIPYPVATLPATLGEGESYTGFLPLRTVQEDVRGKKAKGIRLTSAYVETADDRRFRQRIWPWSQVLREQILSGDLAPAPENTDLLDPYAPLRALLGDQDKNQ